MPKISLRGTVMESSGIFRGPLEPSRPVEKLTESTVIPVDGVTLQADLVVPYDALGIVVFAHGSGSSRLGPRNRKLAAGLNDSGFATLLCDLLSAEEQSLDALSDEYRFDAPFLARRLVEVIDWVKRDEMLQSLNIGLFGAGTGGAAALIAAAERPDSVQAVVSRGGRPDLAEDRLQYVRTPTLLLVGSLDWPVLDLNEKALARIPGARQFVRIQGASHLFEEPGKLEEVANHAVEWFRRYASAPLPPDGGA
jgi:putative phosphoribosyl transferase